MVDDRRRDDGPWLYYKLTNEPLGELKMYMPTFRIANIDVKVLFCKHL